MKSATTRILLVDDETSLTRILKRLLERAGPYEVQCAATGQTAVAMAREWRPAVAIVDMMLPDLSGGEVCQLLETKAGLATRQIIFLTALLPKRPTGSAIRNMGGHCVIAKPVDVPELLAVIAASLSERFATVAV